MSDPQCPKCQSTNTYADGALWICPECAHEWDPAKDAASAQAAADAALVRDANGAVLQDGDSVVVIKDLKVKGSSSVVKGGTKVRNIRLVRPEDVQDGHNFSCKIDGIGSIHLKSEYVRKS